VGRIIPDGTPLVAYEQRWMTHATFRIHLQTLVYAFTGDRKQFFAELKRHWKSIGATSLGGDSVHRSAEGVGWSIKVFDDRGINVRIMMSFPCDAAESLSAIRDEASRHCPAYDPILGLVDQRRGDVSMFYHTTIEDEPQRAGMLLPPGITVAMVEQTLVEGQWTKGSDGSWSTSHSSTALRVWLQGDQVHVSMNPLK
jgi:hypothetical protein